MALIIFAPGIHVGGGAVLLNSLLLNLTTPATVFLDSRFYLTTSNTNLMAIHRVKPTVLHRLWAEFVLRKIAKEGGTILCLANLPPLIKNSCRVFVFVQNSLIFKRDLKLSSRLVRFKAYLQFFFLRSFLRDATIIVQSFSMVKLVNDHLGVDAVLCSFIPKYNRYLGYDAEPVEYDYVYPASCHLHKNHQLLIEAWIILAIKGYRPSLCLTLDPDKCYELLKWINEKKIVFKLNIDNKYLPVEQMPALYKSSSCLIYPAFSESFGLPLAEARQFSLKVVAAELDYVRDILDPNETFDPKSAISIARAVERNDGIESQNLVLQEPEHLYNLIK